MIERLVKNKWGISEGKNQQQQHIRAEVARVVADKEEVVVVVVVVDGISVEL